jgi:hypothetical protein
MLYYIDFLVAIYTLACGCIFIRKRKSYNTAHLLVLLYIFYGGLNGIMMRLSAIYLKNNILFINIFVLIEFCLVVYYYYLSSSSKFRKQILLVLCAIFITILITELGNKSPLEYLNYSALFSSTSLIFLALYSLLSMINNTKEKLITNDPSFWINLGVIMYFSCTLFIFGLERYYVKYNNLNLLITYLLLFFAIVYYSLLSLGLWKASQKQISS